MSRLWSVIAKLFRGIVKALTLVRQTALALLTAVVVLALFGAFNPTVQPFPARALLELAPSGVLVDQLSYRDPFSELLDPDGSPPETLLRELIGAVDAAANDPAITAMVLRTERMSGADTSKILELGDALLRFRASGKSIIASADYYNQGQYLLASHADRIQLHHLGEVEIDSVRAQRSYFADLLERLKIDIHLFRAGEFKDAAEPLVRSTMSDNSRQQLQRLVDQRWELISARIAANRSLPRGALDDLLINLESKLDDAGGSAATLAERSGLVDAVAGRIGLDQQLDDWSKQLPAAPADGWPLVDVAEYSARLRSRQSSNGAVITVVTAAGEILDGEQSAGAIGGDSSAAQLLALLDEAPQAVVLRIDSPGGSAFASELIREALDELRHAGIPVVVSMGSTAASGGYWIATGADHVVAQPSTLTGSIGVFGLLPTAQRGFAALGINHQQVSSTPAAPNYHPQQSLSPAATRLIQRGVDNLYQRFLTLVAEARQQPLETVAELAGGRIWTGSDAHALGLVDQLGGLKEAIQAAADSAGLSEYRIDYDSPELTLWEQLAVAVNDQLRAALSTTSALTSLRQLVAPALPSGVLSSAAQLQKSFNDPHGRYLLCTLCAAN